jgi:CBS domain-containing protein
VKEATMPQRVREVMTQGVETVPPDATVREAAVKMQRLNVGPLPVWDGERVVGMITDRDITVRAVAAGRDPDATPVREVMTPDVVVCFEDQPVDEATEIMKEREVRRLPVLDRSRRLVGIVALGDLAVYAARPAVAEDVLERVSQPAEPERP